MKFFSNEYTESIATMIAVGNNKILTGDAKGDIRLWIITRYSDSYNFHCEQVFSGHLKKVNCLALMPNDRFISSSDDNTMRIWNKVSGYCEKILKGRCGVSLSDCASIAVLPNDLIAVAGNRSPAYGAFDIWDARTGECLYLEKAMVHRPHGMSITAAKGYLAVCPHYHDDLSIWKINRSECTQVSKFERNRIFSMTTSPIGEILLGGDNLHIITLADDGTIQQHKSVENSNCINTVISLGTYRTIIVDSRFNSNRLKLLDYLKGTHEVLGDSRTSSGEVADGHIVLAKDSIVLSFSSGQFCIQQFSNFYNTSKDIAEIRKNSRLLAQALEQKQAFGQLPKELNIKIAALASNLDDEKMAEKIASDYFCRPNYF